MKKLKFFLSLLILFTFSLGNVWGADKLFYTLDGSITTGGNSNYAQDGGGLTQNDIEWSVTGNTTINPWRIGGKNLSGVDRLVYSKTAITDNVTKIEIEHGSATLTVNSVTVEVASNSDFSTVVSSFTPTFAANNTITLTRPDGKDWSNCYYRITYNVTAGSSNSYVQLKSVKFYKEAGSTPEISVAPTTLAFGNVLEDTYSDYYSYEATKEIHLTGSNLTGDVSLSASGDFQIAYPYNATSAGYKYNLTITPQDGAIDTTIVIAGYTKSTGDKSGTLTISSDASDFSDVTVDISMTLVAKPSTIDGAVVDEIVASDLGVTSTSYAAFTDKQASNTGHSSAVYAGTVARNGTATQYNIQLNSGQTNSKLREIASSTSGGTLKRVIAWWATQSTNVAGRKLSVYGSNEAYTGSETEATGTFIGDLTYAEGDLYASLDVTDSYQFVQIVANGAIYADQIDIAWMPKAIADPVISGITPFYPSTTVSMSIATEGADIVYTLDGVDPIGGDNTYSAPFTLTETTTVKARGYKGVELGDVVTKVFTRATPMTVAAALEVIDALGDNGKTAENVFVEGYVKEIVEVQTEQYFNATYILQDLNTDNALTVYRGKGLNNADITSEDQIAVGDKVVVRGILQKYVKDDVTTPEFTSGNYIVERTEAAPAPSISVSRLSMDLGSEKMGNGDLKDTLVITGANLTKQVSVSVDHVMMYALPNKLTPNADGTLNDTIEIICQTGSVGTKTGHVTFYSEGEIEMSNVVTVTATIRQAYYVHAISNNTAYGYSRINNNTTDYSAEPDEEFTLTATALSGYEFVNWTTNNDDHIVIDNVNAATTTATVDAEVTITANFQAAHIYSVVGAPDIIPAGWDQTSTLTEMTLSEGVYSYKLENVTLSSGTNYEYKIVEDHAWTVSYPQSGNATFSVDKSGRYDVTFTLNKTTHAYAATPELIEEIQVNRKFAVLGGFNGWSATAVEVASDAATATFVANIGPSGNYQFKVQVNGSWLSNGYTYHRDFTGADGITTNGDDMVLQVDHAGEYTFTWTFATNALQITFPKALPAKRIEALDGVFSIGEKVKAQFSRGNLCFHQGDSIWYTAEKQYDILSQDNLNFGDATYLGSLDLFGWSCESSNYGLRVSALDKDFTGDFVDWGNLFPGDTRWSSLSTEEWNYLMARKDANNNKLWTIIALLPDAQSTDTLCGLVLFPDNWEKPAGLNFLYGFADLEDETKLHTNTFTFAQWETFEAAGAVFLPTAGSRAGHIGNMIKDGVSAVGSANPVTGWYDWVDNEGWVGYYWLSTPDSREDHQNCANYVILPGMYESPAGSDEWHYTTPAVWSREKRRGNSVRLVTKIYEPQYYLVGGMNDWNIGADELVAADAETLSVTKTLDGESVYEFKVVRVAGPDTTWLTKANNGEPYGLHRGWPGVAGVTDDASENLKLTTDVDGDYLFTWTLANDSLGITFPKPDPGFSWTKTADQEIGFGYIHPAFLPMVQNVPSGVELSFDTDDHNIAVISGYYEENNNLLTYVETKGLGSCVVTASFAGNDDYAPKSISYNLTVVKGTADISWSYPTREFTFGSGNFSQQHLNGTNDYTNVRYNSTNTDVATIDATTGVITLVGGGETTIQAIIENNDYYNDKTVEYTLTLYKQNTSLSWDKAITDGVFTINLANGYTAIPQNNTALVGIVVTSSNENVATVSNNVVTTTGLPGTSIITARFDETPQRKGDTITYLLKVVGSVSFTYDSGWSTDAWTNAEDLQSASVTKTLTKGVYYSFTLLVNGEERRNTAVISRHENSTTVPDGSGSLIDVVADQDGDYIFTWTYATNQLMVTFPDKDPDPAGMRWEIGGETVTEATVRIDDSDTNIFPTFDNPNDVSPVTFSSSDESVATISNDNYNTGAITLLSEGSTVISVYFSGDEDYQEQTASYTLHVIKEEPTGINNTEDGVRAVKIFRNGQLFIIRGDKTYDATGQCVQ